MRDITPAGAGGKSGQIIAFPDPGGQKFAAPLELFKAWVVEGRAYAAAAAAEKNRPRIPQSLSAAAAPGRAADAAIERALAKLRGCPPGSQDDTMNAVAFELCCIIKGDNGIDEAIVKGQFKNVCRSLLNGKSNRGIWTDRDFESKWSNAYEDAVPRNIGLGDIVATYDYTDEAGKLIFQVCRFDPKDFRQRQPNGTGWTWKVKGLRVVPYRLPEVLAAIAAKRTVFIPEGEKDCNNLAKLGLTASCNAGGAAKSGERPKWKAEHAAFFHGADVVVLPHNDDAGRAHGEAVAKSLQGIAARVRVVKLPGLSNAGDVSDWLAMGGDVPRLMELARSAPDWHPATEDDEKSAFEPTPFKWQTPATIPPRPWIYGNHYIRRQAQATIAASKVGKSGLLIVEALAIATGRPLLNITPRERCKVWYLNGEDDRDELQRRFTAAMVAYGIRPEEVEGWLYVDNGREMGITIAEIGRNGVEIAVAVENDIVERLKALGIGVLFIDPFISCHRVPENDNIAIDTVTKTWAKIASRANSAVELAHHIRKPNGTGPTTADDARGGSALIAAVRTARTMTRMTKDEAQEAGITEESERKSIFRLDDAGGNLAPASEGAEWHQFHNIELGNGDGVGVVKRWKMPGLFAENASGDLLAVQKAIHAGEWRESPQSTTWAGHAVAEVLGLDLSEKTAKDRIKRMIDAWIKNKALKVATRDDKKRMPRRWIEVREWANQAAEAANADDYRLK